MKTLLTAGKIKPKIEVVDPLYSYAQLTQRIRERRQSGIKAYSGCHHQARQDKRETVIPPKKKPWWRL